MTNFFVWKKTHKLKYRILVGKTNKARMTSAVAVEFDNAKDAMFAQVTAKKKFALLIFSSRWSWKDAARMEK